MMQKDSGIIAFFNKHACMSLQKQGFYFVDCKGGYQFYACLSCHADTTRHFIRSTWTY